MAAEIKKWHAMIAGNTVGTTHSPAEQGAPTLRDYVAMATQSTLVMQAKQCIINALITDTVAWTDDPDRPVPHELYTFVETAVDYLMVTGKFPRRRPPAAASGCPDHSRCFPATFRVSRLARTPRHWNRGRTPLGHVCRDAHRRNVDTSGTRRRRL
jgi:hypothetical protein